MIQLTHVSKSFNEVYVLKDINISFPKYGIVVIYGPSGCGKSTLLNIISSIYPCEGEVTFNGRHYSTLKEDDKDMLRNQRMGFIFQDYKLFEFDTVKNNVMLAIDIKCSDKKSDKERRVNDLLNLVGLEDKANELVSNLSGGEKQRISLARAIANSPQLLLADEPTGNLDNKT